MKKYLFIIIISLFPTFVHSQNSKTIFLDYDEILHDLNNEGQSSKYFKGLNAEAMLLLDYNCLKDLLKVNPVLNENEINQENFSIQSDSNYIRHYQLLFFTDIKRLFSIQETYKLILKEIWGDSIELNYKLDSEVYIKEPNKAVFTIYGNSWSKTFRLTLKNGLIALELVSQIIE